MCTIHTGIVAQPMPITAPVGVRLKYRLRPGSTLWGKRTKCAPAPASIDSAGVNLFNNIATFNSVNQQVRFVCVINFASSRDEMYNAL